MKYHFPLIILTLPQRRADRSRRAGLRRSLQRVNRQHAIIGQYIDAEMFESPMLLGVFALQPADDIRAGMRLSLIVDFLEILRQQFVDQSGMRVQIALQQTKFQALDLLGERMDCHARKLFDPHAGLRAAIRRQNEQFAGIAAARSQHHAFR